jgi:hypothetical protein
MLHQHILNNSAWTMALAAKRGGRDRVVHGIAVA